MRACAGLIRAVSWFAITNHELYEFTYPTRAPDGICVMTQERSRNGRMTQLAREKLQ